MSRGDLRVVVRRERHLPRTALLGERALEGEAEDVIVGGRSRQPVEAVGLAPPVLVVVPEGPRVRVRLGIVRETTGGGDGHHPGHADDGQRVRRGDVTS
jgi:hypothetical protein